MRRRLITIAVALALAFGVGAQVLPLVSSPHVAQATWADADGY